MQRKKPDYKYKSALLACGAVKLYSQWHYAMHYWDIHSKIIGEESAYVPLGNAWGYNAIQSLRSYDTSAPSPKYLLFDYSVANEYFNGFDPLNLFTCAEDIDEIKKITRASVVRTMRLKKRMRQMLLEGRCVFVTLTFRDEYLNKTTEKQRKLAVWHWLKVLGCKYICNVDYGKEHGREHYHAVVRLGRVPLDRVLEWNSWHGNCDVEHVRLSYDRDGNITDESFTRLAKYVNKLCNHAIKETAKRQVIMYSRSDWEDKVKLRKRQAIKSSFRDLPVIRGSLRKTSQLSPWEYNLQLSLFGYCPHINLRC